MQNYHREKRSALTDDSSADHSDHLIQLHINQSFNSQAWTKFMIAIQGGLGAGYGYVLISQETGELGGVRTILAIMIAYFGVCTSIVIRKIIKRHHQWSAWYVNKYTAIPDNRGIVYPIPKKRFTATKIDDICPGHIGDAIISFCDAVMLIWGLAAFFAVLVWLQ